MPCPFNLIVRHRQPPSITGAFCRLLRNPFRAPSRERRLSRRTAPLPSLPQCPVFSHWGRLLKSLSPAAQKQDYDRVKRPDRHRRGYRG